MHKVFALSCMHLESGLLLNLLNYGCQLAKLHNGLGFARLHVMLSFTVNFYKIHSRFVM